MATITMSRNELAHIPHVPFTETWNPIHHTTVIDAMDAVMEKKGLLTMSETYEVSEDGKDLFATWTLPKDGDNSVPDCPVIGFRNSMKKRFALGVVAGNNVLVCANMCFWGDYTEHRRHTSGLNSEALAIFTAMALGKALAGTAEFRNFFAELEAVSISGEKKKALVYDAMDRGVLAPSMWNKFHAAYDEELVANRIPAKESLMHFHGAVTRCLRGGSVSATMDRTRKLNDLCADFPRPGILDIGALLPRPALNLPTGFNA